MVRWWAVRFIRCGRIKQTSVLRPRTPFRPRHQSFGPHLQVDTGPEPPDWCRSTLRGWEPSLSANRQRIVSFRATAHRFVFGVSGRQRIAAFCVGLYHFSRSSRDPSATPPRIRRPTARRRRQTTLQTGELIRGNAAAIASPHMQAVDGTEARRGWRPGIRCLPAERLIPMADETSWANHIGVCCVHHTPMRLH